MGNRISLTKEDIHLLQSQGFHVEGLCGFFPADTPFHDHDLAMDALDLAIKQGLAMDAQPGLVLNANAGIPTYLTNYIDPKIVEVLYTPMRAAELFGEAQKGTWTDTSLTFPAIEYTGETSAYGDYNQNGSTGANVNFPQRQPFHYQTMTQWGELELAKAGRAKVDWAQRINLASVLVLNKFQNLSYFFGISGLQNYGALNDPSLPAPIAATAAWAGSTADVVYEDIRRLFVQLQTQANGTIDQKTPMLLVMSPVLSVNLNKTNQYNVNVWDQVAKNFPNMRIETAVEYATASGQLMQMIVPELEGQETMTCVFTEKLRAHAMIRLESSFRQKKSQGTCGTVIFRPFLIAQETGM